MLRSSMIVAGAALLCSVAAAQSGNLARVIPVPAQPQDAGIYNMADGKFYPRTQGGAMGAVQEAIFCNNCTWLGAYYYTPTASCEDMFDEGVVPNVALGGSQASYNTNTWEITYVTGAVTGGVDIDFEVYDTGVLGGDCIVNFPTGHGAGGGLPGAFFDSSSAGFPLPGATTCGALAAWIVTFTTTTPVCMTAGTTTIDKFNWRFRQNNTLAQVCGAGTNSGPFVDGEPAVGVLHGCTFGYPCTTDWAHGLPCGNGYGNWGNGIFGADGDDFWINADGGVVNNPPPAACAAEGAGGTGCYWFLGYPTNPLAGIWHRIEADGGCGGCTGSVSTYCTAKVNSLGCTPAIGSVGTPDANAGSGWTLTDINLVGGAPTKKGLFFHKMGTPKAALPFHGGLACFALSGAKRHAQQSLGGQTTACNGMITEDVNVYILAGTDPLMVAGATGHIQGWCRDGADPFGDSLSNAVEFTICP